MEWVEQTTSICVQLPSRQVTFRVFDNPSCQSITASILQGKTYPPWSYARDIRTVLDIGANIGAAALYFASLYPEAHIFAFEPFRAAQRLLASNLATFPNVRVFDYGLLDRDYECPLYLGRQDAVTNSIGQSVLNGQHSVPVRLREARAVVRELQIDSLDILKIDTEGCELPILTSLADLLAQIKVLYIEYHDEADRLAIDDLLRQTHLLVKASVAHPHRGEMCYANYCSFPTADHANSMRIARTH